MATSGRMQYDYKQTNTVFQPALSMPELREHGVYNKELESDEVRSVTSSQNDARFAMT